LPLIAIAACTPSPRLKTTTSAVFESAAEISTTRAPFRANSREACPDAPATRWIATRTHTPLIVATRGGGAREAGQGCCAAFARTGTRWNAIGRHGEVTGTAIVTGGAGNDISQCYELSLRIIDGSAGVDLYVSEQGMVRPRPSEPWMPSPEQEHGFRRFAQRAELVLARGVEAAPADASQSLAARTLFFLMRGDDGEPVPHAVVGGSSLFIAALEGGQWTLRYVNTWIRPWAKAYRPVSIVDVDGDGAPEVIVHRDEQESWDDLVLGLDLFTGAWQELASGVGGSST
jgi:hypothetical protein